MVQAASLVEYGSRRVIITVTAIMCALLEIVDTTIVNVSLNDMQGNLGATTELVSPAVWPKKLFCRFYLTVYDLLFFMW